MTWRDTDLQKRAFVRTLLESGLFANRTGAELMQLLETLDRPRFSASEVLFEKGSAADAMFIVLSGTVQVFVPLQNQSEVVLATLGKYQPVGEQELLEGGPSRRTASARALSDAVLLRIGRAELWQFMHHNEPLKVFLRDAGDNQLRDHLATHSKLFRALEIDGSDTGEERTLAAGEVVFSQGDRAEHLYVILLGTIAIEQRQPDGSIRTLSELQPGQCFGELGLVQARGRAATARVTADAKLLVIPGEQFQRLQESSPELREHLSTLSRVYKRSHGLVSQHTGTFLGQECVTTLYQLPGDHRWVASRVVGQDVFNLERVSGAPGPVRTLSYRDEVTRVSRELRLAANQRVQGITAHGHWPGLDELHDFALRGGIPTPEQCEAFEREGIVPFARYPTIDGDDNRLCKCVGVEYRVIRTAVAQGCRNVGELQQRFGCGTVCGGCIPLINELIARPAWQLVRLVKEKSLAMDRRTFRLAPIFETVAPFTPGQHVMLQARIGDHWAERPYVIVSSAEERGYYEIAVERRDEGLFTNWLFYLASADSLIRVSRPRGDYDWVHEDGPITCLVAGIGVASALSLARSFGTSRRLHVDASVRRSEDQMFAEELRAIAAANPNFGLTLRVTGEQGRVTRAAVDALPEDLLDGWFLLCGPDAYRSDVRGFLTQRGVAAQRIHQERYLPTVEPDAEPDAPTLGQRLARWFGRG